jgi:prophage regulatory protein
MFTHKNRSQSSLASRSRAQSPREARLEAFAEDKDRLESGSIRILRLAQVLNVTGLGKTKIYQLQAEGDFPMRIQITDHSVGWIEEEVQAWLAQRVATRVLWRRTPSSGLQYTE